LKSLEVSSDWKENSNVSLGATCLAASTFINSVKKKHFPVLPGLLGTSGQLLSPINSTGETHTVHMLEKTRDLTQYTIESLDESGISTSKLSDNDNSVIVDATETRHSLKHTVLRPILSEHLTSFSPAQENKNKSIRQHGSNLNNMQHKIESRDSNPLPNQSNPDPKSILTQVDSFVNANMLHPPSNHRNSLPTLFDPGLLVRTEPVGQDLSKSYRSSSAPISTISSNEVTGQAMVNPKVKPVKSSSLDPIIISDSMSKQEPQYTMKDVSINDGKDINSCTITDTTSVVSSTNDVGYFDNLSSVVDYMSVSERLKLLPYAMDTSKDSEKIGENVINTEEDVTDSVSPRNNGEDWDCFMLLKDKDKSGNSISAAAYKTSKNVRNVFDPCIRENSAPVGSESNVQSLNPAAVHLSFSDSEEGPENYQSLPITERERLLPTGADSDFLEREAKKGQMNKSKYLYKPNRSDTKVNQSESDSEKVNDSKLLDGLQKHVNIRKYATNNRDDEKPSQHIENSSTNISKPLYESPTWPQSQIETSNNNSNPARFTDIKYLEESFAAISSQVDQIKTSFDQSVNSRSASRLEIKDDKPASEIDQCERNFTDTLGRFIYGSESSLKTSTILDPSVNFLPEKPSHQNRSNNLQQQNLSSLSSLLYVKESSRSGDTEEDDTDELIRMASNLVVESYTKDISDDSNQIQLLNSNSRPSSLSTEASKHNISKQKGDSRSANESGQDIIPVSEGNSHQPYQNSSAFQNNYFEYKIEDCKQDENLNSANLSGSFIDTNPSSESSRHIKTPEISPNNSNKKQSVLASTETENLTSLSSSPSSSKDLSSQYDCNSAKQFEYDVSQDSDSLGRQVNNLLSRTAYLEYKPSTSDNFSSNVLHQLSQHKGTSPLPYTNPSRNTFKNLEVTNRIPEKEKDRHFNKLQQDLIDLQNGLTENLSIEKKQLGISGNWSPLRNISAEDRFIHGDKDLIDFNEPRFLADENQGSSESLLNPDISKFNLKKSSSTEKNVSLSFPFPKTMDKKKTFESLRISWLDEDASSKEFLKRSESPKTSKNANKKLQNHSNSTSHSSLQDSNSPVSSNESPGNKPLTNDSLDLKDDLSLRVEMLLSKNSYDIPKMDCFQNVRPKEGYFPKASFEMNSSETETEAKRVGGRDSTVMPNLDKTVHIEPFINQTALPVPVEDFGYFDPLQMSKSDNTFPNVSKESAKINSFNGSSQKPIYNAPLIQGLPAPEYNVTTTAASKISNVPHLVASDHPSKSNNEFSSVNGQNNNSKSLDLSIKESLYTTGDLKQPEDIIRNQLNSPTSETNEVCQNAPCDSLNSTKFHEDDVRKCLNWSNMTEFDSPPKEHYQDSTNKPPSSFLLKSSLSQSLNYFERLGEVAVPRITENNSKNHNLSNSKINLSNKPAYLSSYKETVSNHSIKPEEGADFEMLKPRLNPELNTNDNSGSGTTRIQDKNPSPVLHRSESLQKSLILNQTINGDPSLKSWNSIYRSHSLEEFQKRKVCSLPEKKNMYRTKSKNASETLSSSSDSDSSQKDFNELPVDHEPDFERRIRAEQLISSLPSHICMTGDHISVSISPQNKYPQSLPTSFQGNTDFLNSNGGKDYSRIHSKYRLPMENSHSKRLLPKNCSNSMKPYLDDSPCMRSSYPRAAADEIDLSNPAEAKSDTVEALLLAPLADCGLVKINEESAAMYHSSSCDPQDTSSQSKPNPSPSGSDSSTLSQKTWTLCPYKPAGSQDWYYTNGAGQPPLLACDHGAITTATTTTVESGDTGSDDAIGPHIEKEFLGSRPDGPSKPGIYSRIPGKKKANTTDLPLLSAIQERSTLNDKERMNTKSKQEVKGSKYCYRENPRYRVDSQNTTSTFDTRTIAEANHLNPVHHAAANSEYTSSDLQESFRNSSSNEKFHPINTKGIRSYRNGCGELPSPQGIVKVSESTAMHGIKDSHCAKQSLFESVTTVETPSDFSTDPNSASTSSRTTQSSHFVGHGSDTHVHTLTNIENPDTVQQAWPDRINTGQVFPNGDRVLFRSDTHMAYKPTVPVGSQLSGKDSYSQRIFLSSQELDVLWQKFHEQASPPSVKNSLNSSRLEQIQHLVKNPAQALVSHSINLQQTKRQQQVERAGHELELQKEALLKKKLQEVEESSQSSIGAYTSSVESVYSFSEKSDTLSESYCPVERNGASIVPCGSFDPIIAKLRKEIKKQRQKCKQMKKKDKASAEKLHFLTNILVRQMNDLILASKMHGLSNTSTTTGMSSTTLDSTDQSGFSNMLSHPQYCGRCNRYNEMPVSNPRHRSRLKHPNQGYTIGATNFNSKHTARSTESKFGTSFLTNGNCSRDYSVKDQSTGTIPADEDQPLMVETTNSYEISDTRNTSVRKTRYKQDAATMVPSPSPICDVNFNCSENQPKDSHKISVAVQTSPNPDNNHRSVTSSTSKIDIKKTSPPNGAQVISKSRLAEDVMVMPVPLMRTPKKQKSKSKVLHSSDTVSNVQQKKVLEKNQSNEMWFVSVSETNSNRTSSGSRPFHVSSSKQGRKQSPEVRKVSKQNKISIVFNKSFDSYCRLPGNKSQLTLQEAFQNHMANWISRSRERQKRIALAAEKRIYEQQMEIERNQIFQNKPPPTGPDNDPISENLYKPKKRILSRQEMRAQTLKRYRNLPEVKQQKDELIRKVQYRSNKTKSRVFSTKVQRNILRKIGKNI
ncbi:uncharacterized protein LOC115211784, partial [Argonauta hians]